VITAYALLGAAAVLTGMKFAIDGSWRHAAHVVAPGHGRHRRGGGSDGR
jgi:hypothetical protein